MDAGPLDTEYQDEERPEVRGPWQVATLADADWALRRLGECQAEMDEIDALEDQAIQQVVDRTKGLRARICRGVAFFEARITHWMAEHRDELLRGKAKSRDLVNGRIGWRGRGERIVVTDKAALEDWLRAQPAGSPLVRVKVEPVMAEMQKHLQMTGEVPPGCEVEAAGEEPFAKPEKITNGLMRRE